MDQQSLAVAKNDATFFNPALPDGALITDTEVIREFRRSLGRERILQMVLGSGALLWLWSYVRGRQVAPARRRRRRHH